MAKRGVVLGLLAGGLVGSAGCAGVRRLVAQSFTPPTVSFEAISVEAVSLDSLTLTPLFALHNPNAVGFTITALSYDLAVEDQHAASGAQTQRIDVPGNGSAQVPLPLVVRFVDLPGIVTAILGRSQLHYRVSGTAELDTPVGHLSLPLDHRDVLALPGS